MLIKATFKGKDGSLGFVNGKEYFLITKGNKVSNAALMKQSCVYATTTKFLENWTDIQVQ